MSCNRAGEDRYTTGEAARARRACLVRIWAEGPLSLRRVDPGVGGQQVPPARGMGPSFLAVPRRMVGNDTRARAPFRGARISKAGCFLFSKLRDAMVED